MGRFIWFLASSCLLMAKVIADTDYGVIQVEPGKLQIIGSDTITTGQSVSKWSYEACQGCRIILSCAILAKKCDHLLTIFDGNSTHVYCATLGVILEDSVNNKMNVTIMTKAGSRGLVCQVGATKHYTNIQFEEIDSSEFGLGTGAKRQTSCKCGWTNKSPARIIGGKDASPNEYPFMVGLILKVNNSNVCGGSIITPYHILTAAHCFLSHPGAPFSAVVGEHNFFKSNETRFTKVIDIEKTIAYPKYVNSTIEKYDIAIGVLKEKIVFNQAVGPVCLPNARINLLGEYITAMGWGEDMYRNGFPLVLQKVHLRVIALEICNSMYPYIEMRNRHQICLVAPKRDTCKGDSGSPLVWRNPETNRYTQVAVVSYGRECGYSVPSVNPDVHFFMDWIKQVIAETVPHEVCV
uniref:Venom S1 protease 45 n=1 Tax=Platymeris rhadamanthus TaxID=1134088 RepID=A0A6B9KZD4_PLARH|nr:venom S1 protease 45 [Platymeris rhadamanthus]